MNVDRLSASGDVHYGNHAAIIPYALCKHGPHCRRYFRGRCTVGHSIAEIGIPNGILQPARWMDESHWSGGLPGIDVWYGQHLTSLRNSRLLMYIAHESMPYPVWVTMYIWFFKHSTYTDSGDLDFQWSSRMRVELRLRTLSKPPFKWATDEEGFISGTAT